MKSSTTPRRRRADTGRPRIDEHTAKRLTKLSAITGHSASKLVTFATIYMLDGIENKTLEVAMGEVRETAKAS